MQRVVGLRGVPKVETQITTGYSHHLTGLTSLRFLTYSAWVENPLTPGRAGLTALPLPACLPPATSGGEMEHLWETDILYYHFILNGGSLGERTCFPHLRWEG